MMIGEPLKAPREKQSVLRLTVRELLKDYRRRTLHMREGGRGLVLAEGEEKQYIMSGSSVALAVAGEKYYSYDSANKILYANQTGAIYRNIPNNFILVEFRSRTSNGYEVYCFASPKIYKLDSSVATVCSTTLGGTCAAAYHDRLYTAQKNRLYYSKAFYGTEWSEGVDKGGYLDLHNLEAGSILGMRNYKDRLYLMHERGISVLRALGDELNFKINYLPMKYGGFKQNSLAPCGENLAFFTERGLCLFNGATSVLAENALVDEINLSGSFKAFSFEGNYYCMLKKNNGSRALYCYDCEYNEAHFIENGAADIAVAGRMLYSRGNTAYALTPRGNPKNVTPHMTAEGLAFGVGGEKTLRAVAIEGDGDFEVTVRSGRGTRTIRGSAGTVLKLRSALRGNGFDLKISIDPDNAADARIAAVQLRFTEDINDD